MLAGLTERLISGTIQAFFSVLFEKERYQMPRFFMLCRCSSDRTVLFAEQRTGQLVLPSIGMRQSETRAGAFESFIRDHFALDPGIFRPEFRSLGLIGKDPVQIVLCTVDRQKQPPWGPGSEQIRFFWVNRLGCQQTGRFEEGTLGILQDPGIQRLLFELPYETTSR